MGTIIVFSTDSFLILSLKELYLTRSIQVLDYPNWEEYLYVIAELAPKQVLIDTDTVNCSGIEDNGTYEGIPVSFIKKPINIADFFTSH